MLAPSLIDKCVKYRQLREIHQPTHMNDTVWEQTSLWTHVLLNLLGAAAQEVWLRQKVRVNMGPAAWVVFFSHLAATDMEVEMTIFSTKYQQNIYVAT